MIRLIQRRLIVPRGDTGTFSIPVLAGKKLGDLPIFTVFDPLTHRKIFEKVMQLSNGVLNMELTHGDTVNLPVGQYVWDIKFYSDPVFMDGVLVSGSEVDSYYSAFALPECEIRETGDNLLMGDDAPAAKLAPEEINYVDAAVAEIRANKDAVVAGAAEAAISASSAENYASAAAASAQAVEDIKDSVLAAEQSASAAAQAAAASAEQAATTAQSIQAEIPTQVSQLENDAGYLTQHQDISGKANVADLAAVATSGDYDDLLNKPTIPTAVSDLTDDSGHYTKPAGGIPASDLAAGVLDVWSGLTYHTSTITTDSNSFVLGGFSDTPTEINKCLVTSTPGANVIPKFDYQGRLHSTTPEEEWDGSNAVATTAYVDTMISNNMPDVPTNVSELNNDAGYLTSYTETDPTVPSWAKAAQKPSYTAAEVGAPTTQEMNTAIANAIGNVHQFGVQIVQELPTQDIQEHTVYFVPKTGETNDVYDEYIYVNNAWEMIGNTQIDLSNYVQKTDYAGVDTAGVVKISTSYGINATAEGYLHLRPATEATIKGGTVNHYPITAGNQHISTFYGLAKAAGDSTQSASNNAVGTYTDGAKTAIQTMLDVPSTSVTDRKAPMIYKQVSSTSTLIIQDALPDLPFKSIIIPFNYTIENNDLVGESSATINLGTSLNNSTEYTAQFSSPVYVGEYNFITGELTLTHKVVDLGSINYNTFETSNGHGFMSQALYSIKVNGTSNDVVDNLICPNYTTITANQVNAGTEGIAGDTGYYIRIYDSNYANSSTAEFKAAMSGVKVLYKLQKPTTSTVTPNELKTLSGNNYVWSTNHNISVEYPKDTKEYVDEQVVNVNVPVQDVQIDGSSILNNGIASIPGATTSNAGVARPSTVAQIQSGISTASFISPYLQSNSVFYGLAKAAGDTSQKVSTNAVGIYTDEAKEAIQIMLDVPSSTSLSNKADKTDTVLDTTLSIGRKANTTVGERSVALGNNVEASGRWSFATGNSTIASAGNAHAEGGGTIAMGGQSHAEGGGTVAAGVNSHAEGYYSITTGEGSHAEGVSVAVGNYAHTEGTALYGSIIKLTGSANATTYSYTVNSGYTFTPYIGEAIVYNNIVALVTAIDEINHTLTLSVTFGDVLNNTTVKFMHGYATGIAAHTEGRATIAASDRQHVQGSYNVIDSNNVYADIVGNGIAGEERSNAYALTWTGDGKYAGNIYVGCNNDSTGGTRLATITEVAAKLDAAEAGLKVVRLI